MALKHLSTNFSAKSYSISNPKLLTFFPEIQDGGRQLLTTVDGDWQFWHIPVWWLGLGSNGSNVTEFDTLIPQTFIDDFTRIIFQFRLLVTWSTPHGRNASYAHQTWCKHSHRLVSNISIWVQLYPVPSYRHCPKSKISFLLIAIVIQSHNTNSRSMWQFPQHSFWTSRWTRWSLCQPSSDYCMLRVIEYLLVTQNHSRSFEMTLLSRAYLSSY